MDNRHYPCTRDTHKDGFHKLMYDDGDIETLKFVNGNRRNNDSLKTS